MTFKVERHTLRWNSRSHVIKDRMVHRGSSVIKTVSGYYYCNNLHLFHEKEKELGSLISIQKIIILFFYIQRQPTFIYYHKSLSFKPTNTICRQAEDISIRFFVNY